MKKIKTVADLRTLLESFPQDALVFVQGYEGGFTEIEAAKFVSVELNHYKESWNGPHEINESNGIPAVVLLRRESV